MTNETNYPRCATCAHWERNEGFGFEYGKCPKIASGDTLNVVTVSGFDDGHLDYIETSEDFGCINHSEIEKER